MSPRRPTGGWRTSISHCCISYWRYYGEGALALPLSPCRHCCISHWRYYGEGGLALPLSPRRPTGGWRTSVSHCCISYWRYYRNGALALAVSPRRPTGGWRTSVSHCCTHRQSPTAAAQAAVVPVAKMLRLYRVFRSCGGQKV